MKTPRYTAQEVGDALRAVRGVHADAAERLGCHRTTILDYIRRYPEVRQAYEEARAAALDRAESRLIARVERDEWPAIRFMLVTLGRDRGYSLRQPPNAKFDDGEDDDDHAAFMRALRLAYGSPKGDKPDQAGDGEKDGDAPER